MPHPATLTHAPPPCARSRRRHGAAHPGVHAQGHVTHALGRAPNPRGRRWAAAARRPSRRGQPGSCCHACGFQHGWQLVSATNGDSTSTSSGGSSGSHAFQPHSVCAPPSTAAPGGTVECVWGAAAGRAGSTVSRSSCGRQGRQGRGPQGPQVRGWQQTSVPEHRGSGFCRFDCHDMHALFWVGDGWLHTRVAKANEAWPGSAAGNTVTAPAWQQRHNAVTAATCCQQALGCN
jgi:hypothetical protein